MEKPKNPLALWLILMTVSLVGGIGGAVAVGAVGFSGMAEKMEGMEGTGQFEYAKIGEPSEVELKGGVRYAFIWQNNQPTAANVQFDSKTADDARLKSLKSEVKDANGAPLTKSPVGFLSTFAGDEELAQMNGAFFEVTPPATGTYTVESTLGEGMTPASGEGFMIARAEFFDSAVTAGISALIALALGGGGFFLGVIFLIIGLVKYSRYREKMAQYQGWMAGQNAPANAPYGTGM